MSETWTPYWVTCATCNDRHDGPAPLWWIGRHMHGTGRAAYYPHWSTPAPEAEADQ